jgi:hypothetical protein
MGCAVDAENKVLLERPGCYITRELRISGLAAAVNEKSALAEVEGSGIYHARRKRLVRIVVGK